jgi:hypothetical protein
MTTFALVEQALINLGYVVDFNLRYHAKLTGYISVDGYASDIVLEFREGYKSQLGDRDALLQVEWLMDDQESSLFLDNNSLDESDTTPDLFTKEKIILRKIFDRILSEIKEILQAQSD